MLERHVTRCQLCTSNDRDALLDRVAGSMWESRRHGTLDDHPWSEMTGYWRRIYLELAKAAVAGLERA